MSKLIRILVSVALLGLIASQTDWSQVATAFGRLRGDLWLAAVVLLGATQVISALRWQVIASALGFRRSVRQLTGIYFIGAFFNLLLPTSVGGDVVRAWYLDGRSGRRLAAFASVLLDRVSGLLVLLGMACVALGVLPLDLLPQWVPWFVWGAVGCALLGLLALPFLAGRGEQGASRRRRLGEAVRAVRSPWVLGMTTGLSLWVQAANVVVVWLLGLAIQAPVAGPYYWVVVPMVSLVAMLPSIGGMGVRDGGMVLFLVPLGVAKETAVTLSLLWLTVVAVTSLAGGLVYLFGRFPRPVAEEAVSDRPAAVEEAQAAPVDPEPATRMRRAA